MTKLVTLTTALSIGLAMPVVAQDATTVVATVDGTEITLGHMIAMRERLPEQYQSLDDQTLFEGVLEQLIQQTALGAGTENLSRRNALVLENERRALTASDALDERTADAVTEADIESAYDEQYASMAPGTEYDASHILVETEAAAQELVAELGDGADFGDLARSRSTGPSGPSGGALGWFSDGDMVPAFQTAVEGLEVGEVSDPVQTEFGWHVIKLNDRREKSPPPLEEVRGEIESELRMQAVEEEVAEAMNSVEVSRPETGIEPGAIRDDALLD